MKVLWGMMLFVWAALGARADGTAWVAPVCTAATIDKNLYTCYRSFWPELEMTATFGAMGIDTRCFFAANAINSAGFEYCTYPPIILRIVSRRRIRCCSNW